MDQDSNQDPGKRLRSILSNHDDETNAEPLPQDQQQSPSPLSRLPRLKPSAPQTNLPDTQEIASQSQMQPTSPVTSPVSPPPLIRSERATARPLRATADQGNGGQPGREIRASNGKAPRRLKLGPAFWTVTGILSLAVNTVLIAVLLVMYNMLGELRNLQGTASNIGASVLGGMYSNFEKLDRATITTVIPVDAQIPLDITVPVQTTTQITLAETVSIPNAQVVINTGGLNINSNARVTLPAGTPLIVNLNFNLPVQTTIPVHLDVPVNIPMAETELHEPFVGLQEVVRPWYCLVEPQASSLTGQAVCR